MNRIAEELDAKLQTLDHVGSEKLARMVRKALATVEARPPIDPNLGVENGWPAGYFTETAGMFANEPFERVHQGAAEVRESW